MHWDSQHEQVGQREPERAREGQREPDSEPVRARERQREPEKEPQRFSLALSNSLWLSLALPDSLWLSLRIWLQTLTLLLRPLLGSERRSCVPALYPGLLPRPPPRVPSVLPQCSPIQEANTERLEPGMPQVFPNPLASGS